ncbi:hypothetical protein [Streptomyces sp. NPDC018693]|uniref:hypothetical protein n=1 Tax=unclassified Streptomyces TaxID=2593676 RepID=UPI0037BAE17F
MTQSGQGEEPSARPAREGIVLPSDGGEPLLPGMTGDPQGPPGYGGRDHAGYNDGGYAAGAGPQPGPYDGSHDVSYGGPQAGHGAGQPGHGAGPQPATGQTWGQPWGPEQQGGWPLPADQQWGPSQQGGPGPLPPESAPQPSYGQSAPQPSYGSGVTGGAGVPMPPAADEGATQYIPPVTGGQPTGQGPLDGATQYIPPVAARGDEGATQYLPPVAPGALPPESPAEATTYLGAGAHAQAAPGGSDADATQYIPPVTGGTAGRQTPAEFESLFRSGPGGGEPPAASTQQMPRFSEPENAGYGGPSQPSFIPPSARRAVHDDVDDHGGRRGGGRTGSRVPLIAAVGVAIAVVGIGAGALMGGGGGGDDKAGDKTVAASLPAEESPSPSATVDEAEQQAIALDKLLADSGNSRASVIKAVADVKACTNLRQAAADLRAAAQQRNDLVTRLNGLSVDKLPDHAALTSALTKAWQASASADDHYAAWADQVAARKKDLCKKGQARGTAETQAGNRASGTATNQKKAAAPLWNSIARTYGLTERQPVQL